MALASKDTKGILVEPLREVDRPGVGGGAQRRPQLGELTLNLVQSKVVLRGGPARRLLQARA